MKKGDKLFVRIDYKNKDLEYTSTDFTKHVDYLNKISKERYFLGGGFNNTNGGMILFEAKDINDARNIAEEDPIIKGKFFTFDLYEWEFIYFIWK